MMQPRSLDDLTRWWLHTLPPLDGRLRFVVYALLFVLGWTHVAGVFAGPELVFATPAYAYTPRGLASLVLDGRPDAAWVMPLRALTAIAWVAAAVGLCSRPAALITACGAFVLSGVTAGVVGSNHSWYLPVFTLFALAFARSDDRFSLDAQIRRWRGRPNPAPANFELGRTGFARALVLVVAVSLLFMGGVAKLRASGFEWLDGRTVHAYIETDRFPLIGEFLKQRMWACAALSWLALGFELGSPLALIFRRVRPLIVVAAAGFHASIALVMVPRYAPYVVCYLLLIDWQALAARISSAPRPEPDEPSPQALASTPARFATATGSLLVVVLALTTVLRIEWWPLTHVPMYSTYISKERVGEIRKAELYEFETAAEVARECLTRTPCPWALPLRMERHIRVRLISPAGSRKLGDDVPPSQWKHLVSEVAMRELLFTAERGFGPRARDDDSPVDEFLRAMAPQLRAELPPGASGRVVFEYKLRGGFYTMGHLPL